MGVSDNEFKAAKQSTHTARLYVAAEIVGRAWGTLYSLGQAPAARPCACIILQETSEIIQSTKKFATFFPLKPKPK